MQDPFLSEINSIINSMTTGSGVSLDTEKDYLSIPAPNIIEWSTGVDYWGMPSVFDHKRQYQIMRDTFNLRCPICNPMTPQHIEVWNKSRLYLESEVLLIWDESEQDFICPKCKTTQKELIIDEMFAPYNEMIILAGMRSGKSYLGAHIGGYFEHFISTRGVKGGRGYLQEWLKQASTEWFEVTFAASTATQASQTIYAKYREMRNGSPWMNRYVAWVRKQEKLQVGAGKEKWSYKTNEDAILDGFNKVRYNRIASDSAGVAGKTRIMASIDEWARLANTEGSRSAQELYRVLNQSLMTIRVATQLNSLPAFMGMMINVTSPIALDDPAMTRYNQAHSGELTKCYGWKGPTWEFNPYMPREAFDEEYKKDPVGSERDFGANPPNAATPYIHDPLKFWKCINWGLEPTARFDYTYSSDETGRDYIGAKLAKADLDTNTPHYIFCDAGLNWDAFALVSARPLWLPSEYLDGTAESRPGGLGVEPEVDQERVGYIKAENAGYINTRKHMDQFGRMVSLDKNQYQNYGESLVTVVDFAFRIVAPTGRDIWMDSIVEIIRGLRQQMKIASVCFDHWQSESAMQQIRSMGIPSYKVVLKPEHFMQFVNFANTGRVQMLPPLEEDGISLSETGMLITKTPQEHMHGSTIALVELLKLSRSEDLRHFTNTNKGMVKGRDSDDVARCVVGASALVQGSITDSKAQNRGRIDVQRRLAATQDSSMGILYKPSGGPRRG